MKKQSFRQSVHPLFGHRNGQKLKNRPEENEEEYDFTFQKNKAKVIRKFRDLSVIVPVIEAF